ncbi:hypothetical protein ACQY1Q_05935 [Tenacibaculum sp. TC6]|uniref:hypothetical protein n=1 Tax=Tenacibaculum sp. TC6 TaxID=3423223 RepID=UPI003D359E51
MISKEEKINKILDFTQKNNISAYEIAKNTKLTEAGVGKILNKSSKNPRDLTVDEIYYYLFNDDNYPINETTEYSIDLEGKKEITIRELVLMVAENEHECMKHQIFKNIIEVRVAKRISEITASKETLLEYLKPE